MKGFVKIVECKNSMYSCTSEQADFPSSSTSTSSTLPWPLNQQASEQTPSLTPQAFVVSVVVVVVDVVVVFVVVVAVYVGSFVSRRSPRWGDLCDDIYIYMY